MFPTVVGCPNNIELLTSLYPNVRPVQSVESSLTVKFTSAKEVLLPLLSLSPKEIAKVSYSSQEGHVPSAYSIMDLLWVLFKETLTEL